MTSVGRPLETGNVDTACLTGAAGDSRALTWNRTGFDDGTPTLNPTDGLVLTASGTSGATGDGCFVEESGGGSFLTCGAGCFC